MKIIITVVGVLIILVSCNSKMENKHLVLLNGDWQLNEADNAKGDWGNVFSFEDSICSLNRCYSYTKFQINEDTLTIQPEGKPIFPNEEVKKFTILLINADSLLLKILFGSEKIGDTIALKKIKPKNSLLPKEIYFTSTNCMGYCPSMNLKIDSTGRYIFLGGNYCKREGLYSGVLDKSRFQTLITKIQNLPLDSILPRYDLEVTDNPFIGVIIEGERRQLISCIYASDSAPIELYVLFNYLMGLNNYFDTKKDTLLTENYFKTDIKFKKIEKEFRQLGPEKNLIKELEVYIKEFKQSLKHLKGKKYRDVNDELQLYERHLESLKLYLQNDST